MMPWPRRPGGRGRGLQFNDNAHTHNHMTTKMSTYTREELIDACRRGDVECIRRAAASGVALKAVDTGFYDETLLHTASEYDVTLYTL